MQPLPISDLLISVALFGFIIHAYLSGQYVARREPATNRLLATLVMLFSSMWFIGPFTYFGFRKKKPLLARACIRQFLVVAAAWLCVTATSALLQNW